MKPTLRLSLLFALFPLLAFAQNVDVPTTGFNLGEALKGFVSPSGLASALVLIGGIFGAFQFLTTKRKRIIADAAFHIYHLVEDVGAQLDGDDAFDKTARYLKELDAYLLRQGYRPLKPGEVEVAKTLASSQHGFEVAKMKVAEAAAVAAVVEAKSPGNPS